MKYLRRQNLNTGNILDDTVLQRADGNIELNPSQKVYINGDLEFGPGAIIPGPEVTNVLYVTLDGNDDNTGLGEGAGQAKRTLKAALAVADQGATIFVRSGEYYEDNPLRVPPKVSILGDNLRRTIIRPLNGPQSADVIYAEKTNEYVTLTTDTVHGLDVGDRIRVRVQLGNVTNITNVVVGNTYRIVSPGDTNFIAIGATTNFVGEVFEATAVGAGTGTVAWVEVDETDVNITEVPTATSLVYRETGPDIAGIAASGKIKWAPDLFLVGSQSYVAQMVFKGLAAPAYCFNIDDDSIVDTSPYVQNCSNINGPWMRNGVEWLPFVTEQPDLLGNPVTGPRPLLDHEIDPAQVDVYGIDIEGSGGGMLIDGDRYSSESPIKSMVADAFTQVAQGSVGFHVTNFGYMQLVSCFAVFCSKSFYTSRGGYLSVSNSVIDFGNEGFLADGYYPDAYGSGVINQDYYSSVVSVSVTTGQGYTSAPSVLIDPPTSVGGVQAEAVASIDPILGIVNAITVTEQGSGYDFQPNVTISGGGASTNATATANLQKNLFVDVAELSNKPQIGSVMFLDNDPQSYYVTDVSDSSFSFRYDEQKCRRDVGIILDAVLADMLFNSTYRSVSAGLSYLRSYSSKVTSLQKAQTIAGLTEAKNQTLLLTTNPTAQSRIETGFNTVINIINFGTATAPAIVIPTPPVFEAGYPESAAILAANKLFIQDEIVSWISTNYPAFSYNEATCRRDVGYIVDAMRYDLIYGGNTQTINAALAYKEGSVIINEIEETQAAYEYWKTIVGSIVKNIPVVTTTTGQNISLPLGSPVDPDAPKTSAENLLQIIIDVIDNGPGYIPEVPTQPLYANGNPTLLIERNTVISYTLTIQEQVINYLNSVYGGGSRVYTFPAITSVLNGAEPRFHNVSTISTSSTALEYVGAGVTYNALPFFGGEPVPAKERVERDSGKCFTVSSDQIGNYRIGQFFTVNSLTGEVTIDAEKLNLSGLASIGPFRRNGIPVGVQLREVSNNANLVASNGIADPNTVPTQPAVQTYVENRYLNKVSTNAQTIAAKITFNDDVGINGGDIFSTATTFNLLNRDSNASIGEDGPATVNAFLNATTISIGANTGSTSINNDLLVKGQLVNTTQTNVKLFNTTATTVEAFGAATDITIGSSTGTADFNNPTINFPNATTINIDGASPTIASTSTGTLTLFDTLITSVNAFRAATVINIGESTGTLTLRSANTVTDGDLQVKGGDITTNQTAFNLLNTTATTVNAFGAATTLNLGAGSGTTTVKNNLQVNLNTTLGIDTTNSNIYWGVFTANIRDNTTSAFEIKEATNSYLKIDTANSTELTSFGSISKVAFNNVTDASSSLVASATFAGGVGIAKKLYVGTDLNVIGNAALGNDRTADIHTVDGTLAVNVPDNTAIAFQVKENTQTYITAVTTNGSESIIIESTPKLLVKNTTDSTTSITGAVIIDGGVGVAKNLNVGVDLGIGRDVTITGDLSVNGGDITTSAATFNLLNTNATTVNFAGAGTSVIIGATTGTTRVRNSLDVDGDVNIDGGDLTVSTATFNLANTTATTGNLFGAATGVNVGTSAATASTLTFGPAITANTFKIGSTASGTINLTTDVTTGIVNAWQSVTGTINIGASGTINLGTAAAAITTVDIGGAITGNVLKISGVAAGIVTLSSDVTSGTVNAFTDSTGTINIGGQGVTTNVGTTAGNSILEVRGSSTAGTATIRTNSGVTTASVFNTVATTGNLFGAATTVSIGAATGTATINNANTVVTGDLAVNGGDITSSATTFNLLNTTVTTGNLFGAGTTVSIGAATGTTTINNANTVVTGDLAVNGGDVTSSATTFNLVNATATTVNFAGAGTTVSIGAATGTTNVKNNLDVDGDVNIDGGDLTVSTAIFNLANASATTVNAFGAATTIEIGAATGTTNINNNLDVDGDVNVDGGDLTVSTTTFNLANTTATTVNAFGAATSLVLSAATGTTNIRNNLDVDGDINVDGGDITTSAGTFNLANTTATTVNAFGAATGITIGFASPTGLTTIKHDLKVDGDFAVDGALNLGNDVIIVGDLAVNGGDITTSATTFNLLNAAATTVNFAGAATDIQIGAATGTTNINNNLDVDGDINFDGGDITSSAVTVNILAATSTTVNAFGAATALNLGAATGTTIVKNNLEVDLGATINGSLTVDVNATVTGDLAVNGGDLSTNATTFNLANTNATTVNFAGAGTAIAIGAATGTTNIKNNLDVDGDVNIDGGDLTVSTATFNLANTTATTGNLFGAATTVNVGAAGSAGTLTIKNDNVVLDGDLQVKGGDLTTNQITFNLLNATATTVNAFGAATAIAIGAATGTTTIKNNLDVDGDVNIDGGDITTSQTTFNLANTTATILNIGGAGTAVNIGAATGTTTIKNNLDVDGDVNIDGGDLTVSTATFNLANTTATTGNLFGAGTAVTIGATTGTTTIRNANTVVTGDLAVNGADITTTSTGTATVFNTNATGLNIGGAATAINVGVAGSAGTLTIKNDNVVLDGDLQVKGGDITTNQTTFNLLNATATTVNFAGAGTAISIGAATGTTTINNANTVVTGDLAVNGADITTSAATFNLLNATATTVNFAGAGTAVNIGAATGTTTVKNNLDVDGDVNIDGGDLTASTTTFNLLNSTVTTGNLFGAGTTISIGSATGTTTINNANTVVTGDLAVNGGDITTNSTGTATLFNTNATTVNIAGAGTTVSIGAATGTATINNANTVVTGDLAVNGADITTSSTGTATVFNTNATTANAFGAATTVNLGAAGLAGTLTIRNDNVSLTGDLAVNGGDITTSATTFNLLNTTVTTANLFGAATTIEIGAATGTTNINNNLDVDGDVNIDGGDLTVSTLTFNLANTTATTVNFAGAATDVQIGAATGTTNVNNNLDVDGDVNIDGGDLTTSQTTFNLLNTTVTTLNLSSAATTVNIGAAGLAGILTVKNDNVVLDGDLQVKGGDITTNQTAFNLLNTTATTVNAFGAGTTVSIGAATGTTTINNANTVVTGDLAVNGGDVTTSATTFNLLNTTVTTGNLFGAATAVSIGAATGNTTVNNNLIVTGDLTVNGTTTTINTSTLDVEDINITVAKNAINAAAANGAGLTVGGANATITYVSATDEWAFNKTIDVTGAADVSGNVGIGGTLTVTSNTTLTGDLAVNGGDITSTATTFNLLNATVTTGNLFGAGTAISIGAATGTTTINNANTVVTGDLAVNGGDVTSSATTFNLLNATVATANVLGAGTAVTIGATTGTTTIRNANTVVTGDLAVNGADITTSATGTATVFNTNATTVNAFGAATAVSIGAATGTTTINNANTVVTGDLAVNGADITTSATAFNLLNTTATTVNAFGAGTTISIGAATGTATINNANTVVTGDLAVNGGDLTTGAATFNLLNATATTVNFAGAGTAISIGAATGTTTVKNNLDVIGNFDVNGDVNIDGGDLTVSTSTFNLANTTATSVNFAGAGTAISIGAATGTTTINNANTVVTGDLAVNGADITTTATGTATLFNTNATTVNIAGAGTSVNIGAATGTTNVKNNLDVDGDVNIDGGDLTVSTSTFNIANTTATTVNIAGAATNIQIGAATGTTNINNNLDVDGDVNIDGGDLTVSTTTFNLANTTATTGNLFGVATGVNVGISAATASTLTYGPAITGNTFKLAGTTVGTVNYTTDVTSGTVNAWQSVTGTVNLGKSGTINIGNSTTATTAAVVGGAITGNSLKIAGTAAGSVTLNSDVTTGSVNLFNNITTGTLNVAGAGASTINLGSGTSTVNIGVLALTTDLAVQYGGTGRSTFTTNGVIYGNAANGLLVTAASVPGSNATTSYGVLTTDINNVPVWTDVIDGGSY